MRMNINVYLPDDIAQRAKAEQLPLSRMLRDAVTEELKRRAVMAETLTDSQTYEVEIETDAGAFTGRIKGKEIAYDERNDVAVYLTDDERVIAYDSTRMQHYQLGDETDLVVDLRGWLSDEAYADAMHALGRKPVIDL